MTSEELDAIRVRLDDDRTAPSVRRYACLAKCGRILAERVANAVIAALKQLPSGPIHLRSRWPVKKEALELLDWRQCIAALDVLHDTRQLVSLHSIYHGQYEEQCIEINNRLVELTGFNYADHKARIRHYRGNQGAADE